MGMFSRVIEIVVLITVSIIIFIIDDMRSDLDMIINLFLGDNWQIMLVAFLKFNHFYIGCLMRRNSNEKMDRCWWREKRLFEGECRLVYR
jgi:hypothetical protein